MEALVMEGAGGGGPVVEGLVVDGLVMEGPGDGGAGGGSGVDACSTLFRSLDTDPVRSMQIE